MRCFAFSCGGTALLVGCGQERNAEDRAASDTAAAASTAAAEPGATISLSDIAGKWKVRSTDEAGGTPVEVELVATEDTSGWTMAAPGGKPIPVRVVAVAGDSITLKPAPTRALSVKASR